MLHDFIVLFSNLAKGRGRAAVWHNPGAHPERNWPRKAGVVAVSAIVMPKVIMRLTLICLLLAAFTSTWGGARYLPAGQIGDIFLSLALGLIIVLVIFGNLRFTTPFWMWIAPMAVLLCLAIRLLDPIPWNEIILRYTAPPYAPNNFPKAAFWLIALIMVPLVVIGCTAFERRTPRMVIGAFTAGVCVSAAVGLSDLLGFTHVAVTLGANNAAAVRQPGLTNHPVMLGLTCVLAVPFTLYFMFRTSHRWIPAIALLLLFGGALASGSRGSQVAAVLACVVSLAVAPNKRDGSFRFAILTIGGSGLVLLAFAQLFVGDILGELFRFSESTNTDESDVTRSRLAETAIQDFLHHPVAGLGLKWIVQAHSLPLQLLSAGGIILFVAVVSYWICILVSALRLAREGHTLARYLFVSVFSWLALGVIENQLTDRLLYYSIGCIAALTSVYLGDRNVHDDEQPLSNEESAAATTEDSRPQLSESRR
jgi:O-Antigen ligase